MIFKNVVFSMLLAVVLFFSSNVAFAAFDDNSVNQAQAQGQISANDNDNSSYSNSSNRNYNDQDQGQLQGQGQAQGQVAEGGNAHQAQGQLNSQVAKQGNTQNTTIGGDENNTKITNAVWPVTPSSMNKEERSVYSLFGGVGNNKTEEQIRLLNQMQITEKLYKDGVIDDVTYQDDTRKAYEQLKKSNRNPKLLGVLPIADRGCNVLNVCGMLTW